MTKRITKATLKAFIKKNIHNLWLEQSYSYDGRIDGISFNDKSFKRVIIDPDNLNKPNLGVPGIWITDSDNLFTEYCTDRFYGIEVYNCCGCFTIAIER